MPLHIDMPKLSDTMTEGTLVKWRKKIGDSIEMGDVIAEVETDKATMEMEAFEEGVIHKFLVEEGGKAAVGEQILILLAEDEDAPSEDAPPEKKSEPKSSSVEKSSAKKETPDPGKKPEKQPREKSGKMSEKAPSPEKESTPTPGARIKASPLARKIAAEKSIDLSTIQGSGPDGRIVAADVHDAKPSAASAKSAAPKPAGPPPGEERTIPLSGMRKTIARRLVESKSEIPHFYLNLDVDAGPLLALRAQIKEAGELAGAPKLTVNDFVLRAAALAAVRVPRINATYTEDAIIEYGSVHLSVAVSLDDGLITPVLRDAQSKPIALLSAEMKDLAARARGKKLKPEEYQGGTLGISNLGAYGVGSFYAIINPPQAANLAIGAIVKKPVVDAAGNVVAGNVMNVGLSGDHRVADGAIAAEFLAELRKLLENPSVLLL